MDFMTTKVPRTVSGRTTPTVTALRRLPRKRSEDHEDKDDGLDERLADGIDGGGDELGAVVKGNDADAVRQGRLHLLERLLDGGYRLLAVGAATVQDETLDHLAFAVAGDASVAGQRAES
jgi:hypothetical protein